MIDCDCWCDIDKDDGGDDGANDDDVDNDDGDDDDDVDVDDGVYIFAIVYFVVNTSSFLSIHLNIFYKDWHIFAV